MLSLTPYSRQVLSQICANNHRLGNLETPAPSGAITRAKSTQLAESSSWASNKNHEWLLDLSSFQRDLRLVKDYLETQGEPPRRSLRKLPASVGRRNKISDRSKGRPARPPVWLSVEDDFPNARAFSPASSLRRSPPITAPVSPLRRATVESSSDLSEPRSPTPTLFLYIDATTSADEAIYRYPIGPTIVAFSEEQLGQIREMIRAIVNKLRPVVPGYQGGGIPGGTPPGGHSGGGNDALGPLMQPRLPHFNPGDIGFYDPFYDGKSSNTAPALEHAGKYIYFRDMHVFVDRLKDVTQTMDPQVLRENLQLCLRGTALEWYIVEISDMEKRLVKYGDGLVEWTVQIITRFKPPQ